ncbi:hypothetical protein [Helicobacter suis]|uniref:hypothetical protein n=1 Tax=Helicobacter suis TaxID=104628 RepID=UPI00249010D4|nr:hypothetical protein [Helicobacter suis]
MRILLRSEIEIIESNLEDHTPFFDPDKTYQLGDIVRKGTSLFECTKATEEGAKPNFDTDFTFKCADNTTAAFDSAINTISEAEGYIKIRIKTKGSIFLSNFECDYLRVSLLDSNYLEKYTRGTYLSGGQYLLENSGAAAYDIYLENAPGKMAKIGVIFCGEFKNIGITEYQGSLSIEDFSKITTDEEGRTSIKIGYTRKTYKSTILLPLKDLDWALKIIEANKSIPSVVELSNALECLTFFGLIRNVDISFLSRDHVSLDLECEELT